MNKFDVYMKRAEQCRELAESHYKEAEEPVGDGE